MIGNSRKDRIDPAIQAEQADKYFDEAQSWDADQRAKSLKSEKRAWLIAGVFGLGMLLSLGANFMLFPLKEIQNNIIRVDSVTGLVDVQRELRDAKLTYSEATDKYWLRLYVRQREGFMYALYDDQYKTIGLLSAPSEQKKWYEFYRGENPAAPVNQYGQRASARVIIRSVSFIDKSVATVRFTRLIEQPGATTRQTFWIATVKFRYVNPAATEADREINPLGFQVTEYRVDSETDVSVEAPK